MSQWSEEPLFEVTQPPVRRAVASPAPGRVTWSRLSVVAPPACDVCAKAYTDPYAPLGRRAKYRRITSKGEQWLCHPHANDQRVADGLAKFK